MQVDYSKSKSTELELSNFVCRSSSSSSSGLFSGRCRFHQRPPCLSILCSMTGSCQTNKKHLKNVGPIRYCEPFYIAIHQVSLLSHAACASMSTTTTTTTTTTTRDRRDRYGPMEWPNDKWSDIGFNCPEPSLVRSA